MNCFVRNRKKSIFFFSAQRNKIVQKHLKSLNNDERNSQQTNKQDSEPLQNPNFCCRHND